MSPHTVEATTRRPNDDGDDESIIISNQVRDVLRERGIKLWLDPYVDDQQHPVEASLERLVETWAQQQDGTVLLKNDLPLQRAQVLQALRDLQSHALEKLRSKQQQQSNKNTNNNKKSTLWNHAYDAGLGDLVLEVRALGLEKSSKIFKEKEEEKVDDGGSNNRNTRFATHIQRIDGTDKGKGGPVVFRLEGVSSRRTVMELLDFLKGFLQAPDLKLIHRGRNIAPSSTTTSSYSTLDDMVAAFQKKKRKSGKDRGLVIVPLLCLISSSRRQSDQRMEKHTDLHARITALRTAARQLQNVSKLEITDQHGRVVPMNKDDRIGFMTALALHRMGLSHGDDGDSDSGPDDNKEERLVLLLEADAEWNQHPNLQSWRDMVDNYGLLQLDICWLYLQMESLSNLPDSVRRLKEAERVLLKQVHKNFVTLALAQADNGNHEEVPPLAAVFAKLFLLQGIAYSYESQNNLSTSSSSTSKGQECLDQAFMLLQSLRSVAPKEKVQSLLDVMGSSESVSSASSSGQLISSLSFTRRSDAVAALRKSQGDVNAAANLLSEAVAERQQRQRDRDIQHRYGLCSNEKDPVSLGQVKLLQPMLPLQHCNNSNNDADHPLGDGGHAAMAADEDLAVGLLRLANNELVRALEIYKEQAYNCVKVQTLVDDLDHRLVQQGLLDRGKLAREKRRKVQQQQQRPVVVDEIALATLLSMEVDPLKARQSLQKSNNDIDQALLLLATSSDQDDETERSTTDGCGEEVQVDATSPDSGAGKGGGGAAAAMEEGAGEGPGDGVGMEEDGDLTPGTGDHRDDLEWDAEALLYRELGGILEERDLEKEYLGSSLDTEWDLVCKYRGPSV